MAKYSPIWLHKDKFETVEKLRYKILDHYGINMKKNEMIEKIIDVLLDDEKILDEIIKKIK